MSSPTQRRLCIAGRIAVLKRVADFCRTVYIDTFGPVKGQQMYAKLPMTEAVALYLAACKDGTAELPA